MGMMAPEPDYGGWKGSNPYYLLIVLPDENVGIDLDESGWMTTYAQYMRAAPAQWLLMDKLVPLPRLMILVQPGDQPYYTARHIGTTGGTGELTTYGIGAKRVSGIVERLWLMPNGSVCTGEDVGDFGVLFLRGMAEE